MKADGTYLEAGHVWWGMAVHKNQNRAPPRREPRFNYFPPFPNAHVRHNLE